MNRAIDTLKYQNKKPSTGDIIAELNFGFWTSLFDVRYERIFWQKLIKDMFPSMPRRLRTRHTASARLNRIRKLRNRVFHYEPIWHWADLQEQYREILETTHWISPETATLVHSKSRFPGILTERPQ